MKRFYWVLFLMAMSVTAISSTKYVGGDISLLTKYEEHGAVYYNENGARVTNLLTYLKNEGLNAMRLRLFVDPSMAGSEDQGEGVCQDLPYVKALGKRIKAAGFNLLLDIHYSDTWTDPAQHSTPSSWTVFSAIADSVYSYTKRVLNAMIAVDATPDFIQVGNEVTYGMLWPSGRCFPSGANYGSGTFATFANYLKQGIKACREVCPSAQIIVHTEMGRVSNVTSFYNTLKNYTSDYDIIGLSYYPYWHGDLSVLDNLLTTLESSYPTKKIQLVETGYPHAYYPDGASYDLQSVWPATEEGQRVFAEQLVAALNNHSQVNGLYWWFPEANENGINYTNCVTTSWYNCGWWDNANGQVMDALFEMADFLDGNGDDPQEQTDIYIIGDDWSLTAPYSKMTNMGNGIYEDTLTIGSSIYFVFADGGPDVWNDDWDVFNSGYRYGPTSTTMITTDSQYTTAKNNNNYSYYFTGDGSSYKVTFNLEELTFKFEVIDTPSGPDYPETTIYIVGGESGWSLTEPLGTMTHLGNGIYVDTLTINTPIYFVFADGGPGLWNDDWGTFNSAYRFGPASTTTITTGSQYVTAKRNNNYSYYFTGDGSDYLFTFDLGNLMFRLDVIVDDPELPLLGDVNDDKSVDVTDVTVLISYILGFPVDSFNAVNADVDGDGGYSVSDVTQVIELILNM